MIRTALSIGLMWALAGCQKPSSPASSVEPGPETSSTEEEDAPWRCNTQTCEEMTFECGVAYDSCGSELNCGTCDGSKVCYLGHCMASNKVRHERADNAFAGAHYYVKPGYAKKVKETIRAAPSDMHRALHRLATMPTAIWLERIAAIHQPREGLGLRQHLDEALRQQARNGMEPLLVTMVVYDLPDRDCAAGASAGELKLTEDGLRRYKEEFIDAIIEIIDDPKYRSLRLVTILEPDSLPNLVTNMEMERCKVAGPAYREGITYAIQKLSRVPNAYIYLDIAHSGWMGWDNPAKAAEIYRQVLQDAGGEDLVEGFATNISNYTPLEETIDPYLVTDAYSALIEGFYGWNRVIDEHTFAAKLREQFPNHGVIIDTGRNGWGTRKGDVPRDGRFDRGNWCNVKLAGLGQPPQADPKEGIDAYFWVKPPGESDGAGDPSIERPGVPTTGCVAPMQSVLLTRCPTPPRRGLVRGRDPFARQERRSGAIARRAVPPTRRTPRRRRGRSR